MAPHDKDARGQNADLSFEGKRSGMNRLCSDGEYIGFCVTSDRSGFPCYYKGKASQAEAFAKSVLEATNK